MSRFPYSGDISPIVQVGEFIRLIGSGKKELKDKYWKVDFIEPIHPFLVDFTDAEFYNAVIPANGTTGYDTGFYKMDNEMEMPDYVLGQFRIIPIDDLLLLVGHDAARNIMGDTKKKTTYISKTKPRHSTFSRTTNVNTEASLWIVTDNAEAGARKAKIVKLSIQSEAATAGIVRLGDGDGTGTDANAANADMSFSIGAGESLTLSEDEIPETEFWTGVSWQTSVQPLRITITVEEDNVVPPTEFANNELFVWGDGVPYFRPINANENQTLTKARISLFGYKLMLSELESKPSKFTEVPVSAMPRA